MSNCNNPDPHTASVHAGEQRPKPYNALANPIFQTANYSFENTQALRDYVDGVVERDKYGRYGNPTQRTAERKLAELEGGEQALLFPSGMAATTIALLAYLKAGDHLILSRECYKQIREFAVTVLNRFGVEVSQFDPNNLFTLEAKIKYNTKLIFVETPSNPFLSITDIKRVVQVARPHDIAVFVDSTFATPINQKPLEYGVDLVIHSATKYLAGHNDLLAGVVIGSKDAVGKVKKLQAVQGSIIDPHNAYLLWRGLKTLALRVEKQNQSALEIAQFLEDHPSVKHVYYPGLKNHPTHQLAKEQMTGFGGVISFEVDADDELTGQLIDTLQIPLIASSLGGVDTLIEQSWLISYAGMSKAQREELGVGDNFVRLSVGIEDAQALIDDLAQGLSVLDKVGALTA